MSVSIEHILETHNQADQVYGPGRLAPPPRARANIHREAFAEYEKEPFSTFGWRSAES